MATRHQVRQAVIGLLYACEMGTKNDEFTDEFLSEQKIKNKQKKFALDLFNGILFEIPSIDEQINLRLTSFKLNELGAMERAILRLGAFELANKQSDARVIISEAVLLASEFGSYSAIKLVNGVLNSIFKGEFPEQSYDEVKILCDNLQNDYQTKESSATNTQNFKAKSNSRTNSRIRTKSNSKAKPQANSKTRFDSRANNSAKNKNAKKTFNNQKKTINLAKKPNKFGTSKFSTSKRSSTFKKEK